MDKFLNYYIESLKKFSNKKNIDKNEVNEFINELIQIPIYQCFDFIKLIMDNKYEHINEFEILWYASMMEYVGTTKTTKDVILKLALTDLCHTQGESSLLPILFELDRIHLEEKIHESVNYNEIKKLLLESDLPICNLVGDSMDGLLKKWHTLSELLTL